MVDMAGEVLATLERELRRAARLCHDGNGVPYDTLTLTFSNEMGAGLVPMPRTYIFTITPAEDDTPYDVPQVEPING